MKVKLSPNEQALFHRAMRGVKPLITPKREMPRPLLAAKKKKEMPPPETESDSFSDYHSLPWVDSEEKIEFSASGVSAMMLRRLRRGYYPLEAILDLHGNSIEKARQALHHFLLNCQSRGKVNLLIIHGKGQSDKPILKNKLNHWLRQSNQVLAFCSAKFKDGGPGALYVRIKTRTF